MFILIMGVTGSGKTTIGNALSSAIGWPFYDADEFHSPANVRKMTSGVPLTDEDRAPWLQQLRAIVSERSERGENGILACSALKASYRSRLSSGINMPVVYLKADPRLVRGRLAGRSGHYMPPSLIESQFLDLEVPDGAIGIEADLPVDQIIASIRSQLHV